MHLFNFQGRRLVMRTRSNPNNPTVFLKPYLCLRVRDLLTKEEETWMVDVASRVYLYFNGKGDKAITGMLYELCEVLKSRGILVIGYGSYAGEGEATHVIRNGHLFAKMNGEPTRTIPEDQEDSPVFLGNWTGSGTSSP